MVNYHKPTGDIKLDSAYNNDHLFALSWSILIHCPEICFEAIILETGKLTHNQLKPILNKKFEFVR